MPLFAGILSSLLWGSSFFASKNALHFCPPFIALTLRYGIAVLVLMMVARRKPHDFQFMRAWDARRDLILLGIVSVTALSALSMWGLQFLASSQSAVIMLLAPVFSVLIEALQRRKLLLRECCSVLICLGGACWVLGERIPDSALAMRLQGLLPTLASSICLGWSVPLSKRVLARSGLNVFNLTLFTMTAGAFFLCPLLFWDAATTPLNGLFEFEFWLWIFYLGIACSAVAFLLWNVAVRRLPVATTAALMYLETPFAIVIGVCLLNERRSLALVGGTAVILAGLILGEFLRALESRKEVQNTP